MTGDSSLLLKIVRSVLQLGGYKSIFTLLNDCHIFKFFSITLCHIIYRLQASVLSYSHGPLLSCVVRDPFRESKLSHSKVSKITNIYLEIPISALNVEGAWRLGAYPKVNIWIAKLR